MSSIYLSFAAPEANLINNLMVDCSQFTLSWTNNLELSAFDRIDYYGLEASCTNSSEYVCIIMNMGEKYVLGA